jgi:hypothetical protein
MARQLLDYKFASKIRELEMSGRKEDADRLKLFAATIDQQYGPEMATGVRDYIANGFPTTAEGEALLLTQRGEMSEMVRQMGNGQISFGKGLRQFAGNIVDIDKQYGESLRPSESAQKEFLLTGKALNTAVNTMQQDEKTEQQAKKDLDDAYKRSNDSIKNTQKTQLENERRTGQSTDDIKMVVSGPVNDSMTKLASLVTYVAKKMAYLARWLSGGDSTEAFNNVMTALGDANDLKELSTRLTEEAKKVDKKIKEQESSSVGSATISAKQRYEKALEEQQKLIERKKLGQTVTGSEERNIIDSVNESRMILEQARTQERKRYGKTTEELKAERESLLKRAEEATKSANQKSESEQRQTQNEAMAKALDESSLNKYISFGLGSGDFTHFSELSNKNPVLASNVARLAEEYYKMNNGKKKLSITSSFRSNAEQQAIYDAWTRNPTGSGYYTPHNPSKGPGPHTRYSAVDIDSRQLDSLGASILSKFGLERRNPKDPVHVTLKNDIANFDASQIQALNPDFIAHGSEAILPMTDGKTVGMEMKPPAKTNDFSESKASIIKVKPDISLVHQFAKIKPNKTAIDNFMDKLDGLGRSIDQSTSVQHDIKMYSMS